MPYKDPIKQKEYFLKYKQEHRKEAARKASIYYYKNRDSIIQKRKDETPEEKRERRNKIKHKVYKYGPEHSREWSLRSKYGLTSYDVSLMEEDQAYSCFICGYRMPENAKGNTRLCVDHCHNTNRVRKLLCHNCNKGLGNLQDSWIILQRAADYLKEYQND